MQIKLSDAKCKSVEILSSVELLKPDSNSEANENFRIKAYTGQTIDRYWGKLAIALDGISAKNKLPIFRGHYSGAIVGHSTKAYIDGGFYVEGKFSKATEAARETKELAIEGFPWQASIGVRATKVMRLTEGETETVNGKKLKGPAEIWLKSNVFETSFVTFGADNKTSVETFSKFEEIDEAPQGKNKTNNLTHEEVKSMEKITMELLTKNAPELLAQIQTEAKASGYDAGLKVGAENETKRVNQILAVENADEKAKNQAVTDNLSIDEAYKLFFVAEINKKKEELECLEKETPESIGQKGKKVASDSKESFMQVVDAYQAEKSCTRAEALKAVVRANPDLHKAFLSGK